MKKTNLILEKTFDFSIKVVEVYKHLIYEKKEFVMSKQLLMVKSEKWNVKSHEDLVVWKMSVEFVTTIYKVTKDFPKSEMYGLTSQIRRSAVSIPSNIAEGAARKTTKEYIQFVYISLGSIAELETQLLIAKNLNYLENTTLSNELKLIKGKTINLINSLNNKLKKNDKTQN